MVGLGMNRNYESENEIELNIKSSFELSLKGTSVSLAAGEVFAGGTTPSAVWASLSGLNQAEIEKIHVDTEYLRI